MIIDDEMIIDVTVKLPRISRSINSRTKVEASKLYNQFVTWKLLGVQLNLNNIDKGSGVSMQLRCPDEIGARAPLSAREIPLCYFELNVRSKICVSEILSYLVLKHFSFHFHSFSFHFIYLRKVALQQY